MALVLVAVLDVVWTAAAAGSGAGRCQLAKLLVDDGWLPEAWERRASALRSGRQQSSDRTAAGGPP